MPDVLTGLAAALADKAAIIDDRPGEAVVTVTFAELEVRANQLAHLLGELGAGPGVKVVWCGQNSASLLVATHAIRKVGAVGVPLNYRLTREEAAYVVDNSDAQIMWVDAEYLPLAEAIRPDCPKLDHVLVFDTEGNGRGAVERRLAALPSTPPPDPDPEAGAGGTMIYTSGTTGRPKGALRGPATDPSQIGRLIGLIGYQPDDVYITTGPLYHSGPGGFAGIAHSLGNTVVVQHHFDPEDWLRLVETHRVTTSFTAPTPVRMICTLPGEVKARYDRSSMKRLIANAAPWTLALKKLYLADFPTDSLWEVYGSTELGVDTVLAPDDHLRKPGSCGKPAPGVEIKLFTADGAEVTEPHTTGELYVRAKTMFSTYYKAEEKYEADRRGEYHTVGDIAYFDEDGYFYIADRKNDMIISGGMNIYPAEIEAAIDANPDVFEVAVFGVPDEQWGERVHAVVVPARQGVTVEQIQAQAREHLAGYKVPRSITFAESLPKTGSGKVLKRELRQTVVPPAS
ncbi:MAG TPA: AMP-binding protein [Acidimicrobiales bacterium]|nr:AMP-binding protein [Acidimicrobiales bacterium]